MNYTTPVAQLCIPYQLLEYQTCREWRRLSLILREIDLCTPLRRGVWAAQNYGLSSAVIALCRPNTA